MPSTVPDLRGEVAYRLWPFDRSHAETIASWISTRQALRWLAPSSHMPLTAAQVIGWCKPTGRAFVFLQEDRRPIAYGEVTPMARDPGHAWLGHIIVAPECQGSGIGRSLVRGLLAYARARWKIRHASLVVFPDNRPAIRCYQHAGFREVGEEYHQFGGTGPRHRLLRMSLDLSP